MMMHESWFTERCVASGTVQGFKVTALLHKEETPYQTLEVYETESFGHLMVLDGCVMLTSRDNFLYHEMMAHPVLFSHSKPSRVLIIGGGDCGTLREVLKHAEVEWVDQVEIDERVTRISERYFPELCVANKDPRAHFHFEDALSWVKAASANDYDVVIIDSADPVGPGKALFSQSFYQDCNRLLRTGGMLVHQSESPLLHLDSVIKPMWQQLQAAQFSNLRLLQFPQPCYPSGWWSATMAAKHGALINFREQAARERRFNTNYYNVGVHHAAFAQAAFIEEVLETVVEEQV
jgi:spermidine synthase